jgi:methionyl-tRNA formyltransferase
MPSFWMLANNESEAGLTLFYVNAEIDAGDILMQRKFLISPGETLDSLIRKSKRIGAEMLVDAIRKIDNRDVKTVPLEMEGGSYFGWPKREDVLKFLKSGRKLR